MPRPQEIKAIDAWVNLNPPSHWIGHPIQRHFKDSDSLNPEINPVGYLFPGAPTATEGATPPQIIEMMDEAGIEIGLLNIPTANPDPALEAIAEYPDRFVGAVSLNPHKGIEEVRRLEKLVIEHNIKAAKVSAHTIQKPYNDKIYYPIYMKCIELNIPITANVGIPGPRVPGEAQNPIYLDEVCWFFPELKVVMTHGGEPWQFLCVKLMLKWPNLFYMTSSFSPKYLPQDIIQYMNTRGSDKVMFATGYPNIPIEKCTKEARELPLKAHVPAKFLRENAIKVFELRS